MWFHQEAGIFWFALTMSMSGYTLHNDFAESKTWSQMGFRSGLEIGRDSLCKTMRGVTVTPRMVLHSESRPISRPHLVLVLATYPFKF